MTAKAGPRNDLTDIDGLLVGQAQDKRALTGVTFILAAKEPVTTSCDIGGGGPATRETDLLRPENLVQKVDAICLSGGSVFGLAAADEICIALASKRRGYTLPGRGLVPTAPIVPAACLYDLSVGKKNWGEAPPYQNLARQAFDQAWDQAQSGKSTPVSLGAYGAGAGARAGSLRGGIGSASILSGDLRVAALVAVNSFGSVLHPKTKQFWAADFALAEDNIEISPADDQPTYNPVLPLDWAGAKGSPGGSLRRNTSLAVVATNASLDKADCKRVSRMAHDGMARAIRPVHTPFDGDIVFALATGDRAEQTTDPQLLTMIGSLAADCVARAIMRGVQAARGI